MSDDPHYERALKLFGVQPGWGTVQPLNAAMKTHDIKARMMALTQTINGLDEELRAEQATFVKRKARS